MYRISIPATSANLGPGFDCLGIALDLYDTFDVELCDRDLLENTEERFRTPDNLFLKAYRRGCRVIGADDHIRVIFHADIPAGRGLGTSAAITAGGLYAASVLHDNALSREEIFRITAEMEGHPDNAAPAVYGGLCLCLEEESGTGVLRMDVSDQWVFTALVPDFEVHTEEARAVLPKTYDRPVIAWTASHLYAMTEALRNGDETLLHKAAHDRVHEPYRRNLIPDYSLLQKTVCEDTGGVLLISGSGSTCLLIAKCPLSPEAEKKIQTEASASWKFHRLAVSEGPVTERIQL